MASAVWVSGRDPIEAEANSVFVSLPEGMRELVTLRLDHQRRTATYSIVLDAASVPLLIESYRATYPDFDADWDREARRLLEQGSASRSARYFGDQGCILMPADGSGLKFSPVQVRSTLPEASTQDWPMGDRNLGGSSDLDGTEVQAAVDAAFADPEALTAAFLALHRGRIVGERYALGIGPDTQLESWSMGKSLTATLLGVLVRKELLELDQPAPVPAWQGDGDPRSDIRIIDLLRMSSGLRFSHANDPRESYELGVPDHLMVYAESMDVFEFSISRPREHPPNTVGRYRNCDTLTLGYIIRRVVEEGLGEEYLTWPQRALFDRVGIRRQVMETDPYGNFILTGYDYGTARNWARLGLLYMQDGVWNGERILPEGYAQIVSTPAPAWKEPEYGGQFWVNGTAKYALPRAAYYMAGLDEQRVFIVPSHDLVVVRLGHRRGGARAKAGLDRALAGLVAAVEASRTARV